MEGWRVLAGVAVLVFPVSVGASQLPVTYLVQEHALKKVVAATNLSFDLYSDAGCGTLVHSQLVPVEQVAMVSRLKLLTPKGAAKAPRTDELRHTLEVESVSAPLYLRVTGPGVVSAGPACQVQISAVGGSQGLQGEPGAQGPTGLKGDEGEPGNQGPPVHRRVLYLF